MAREPGKLGSHLNQRVSKLAAKLDDHKLILGVLVGAAGAFLAYVAFASTTGPPFQSSYAIDVRVPASGQCASKVGDDGTPLEGGGGGAQPVADCDAPVLRTGQEVRISGKLAGLISDVQPDRETGGTRVTANITKPEFRPLGKDAWARVTVHSIVYRTYLELFPGNTDDPMEGGDTIEADRVSSGVDLLEVIQLFDESARRSLSDTLVNVGFGVAGRGTWLNEALAGINPTAKNLRAQLNAATSTPGALGEAVRGAAATTEGLRGVRGDDLGAGIASGADVLGTVAAKSTELAETIRRLPPFEDELLATGPIAEPLLSELAVTASELQPAVRGITAALPDINRLLALGDELRTESGRIADLADPVLAASIPIVKNTYPVVSALNPLLPNVQTVVDNIGPYKRDIAASGERLASVTSVPFPQGQGPGAGSPMGRVIFNLGCHSNRNPFPEPGAAEQDSQEC